MDTIPPQTETRRPHPSPTNFNIGWICVLKEEYRAAVSILDEKYDDTGLARGQGDRNHYCMGRIGTHNVVINMPPVEMYGLVHASRIALNMRSTFPQLRFTLLVGIAGAAPSSKHDVRLGDVVLGTKAIPYNTGKMLDGVFERTGLTRSSPREILEAITYLDQRFWNEGLSLSQSIERVRSGLPGGGADFARPARDRFYKTEVLHQELICDCLQENSQDHDTLFSRQRREGDPVRLHYGRIGSDNQVMKNAVVRDEITQREKILCFEMEAAAVMDISPCLPIRGMSDYSDGHKNDDWHLYASLAAAVCARELLLAVPSTVVAQFPLTLVGKSLNRYIEGAFSNPNAFAGSDIEKLKRNRDSLMERHDLLQDLVILEARNLEKVGQTDEQNDDEVNETRRRVQELKDLQSTLKTHLEGLNRIIDRHSELLADEDLGVRKEYSNLKTQVEKDQEAMKEFSNAAEGTLHTIASLLKEVGVFTDNKDLGIGGLVFAALAQLFGKGMALWSSTRTFSAATWNRMRTRQPGFEYEMLEVNRFDQSDRAGWLASGSNV